MRPPLHRHLGQAGRRQDPADERAGHPVVGRQVGLGRHAERASRRRHEMAGALLVRPLLRQQLGRHGALGQVVDACEATPLAADERPDVEQPFGGDLGLGPVPPRTALLGAAQLVRGQGTVGTQTGQHVLGARVVLLQLVPALPLRQPGPALEGVGGPVLERHQARRVGPVLEGGAPRPPVGALDASPADRPLARVRHQLVRARQHRDGVELHRAEPPQHGGHTTRGRPSAAQSLRAEGDAAGFLDAQRVDHGCRTLPDRSP